MSPDQFLSRMKKGATAPAYLFLGPEAYGRDRCREALIEAMLGADDRDAGLAQYDLRESALPDVVEDARAVVRETREGDRHVARASGIP